MSSRGRPREPLLNLPRGAAWLFYFSIAVHFFRLFLSVQFNNQILFAGGFVPARLTAIIENGAIFSGVGLTGGLIPLFSYNFLHADWMHILFNMLWLMVFGAAVGRRMGDDIASVLRFIALFLLCGLAGAAAHYVAEPTSPVPLIGGSAGIAGLMGATTRLLFSPFGYRKGARTPLAPVTEKRVLAFGALFILINLIIGLGGLSVGTESGVIAWQAHIGGYLAGLFLMPVFDRAGHS